ncbi:MAG: sugar phosphate isomerase/epimerase [Chloroflexi bacterium]|nr:sugar phosphate isomerase/epimerase [Chloroflexota bacterium]
MSNAAMFRGLSFHTGSLDATPLPDVLRAARETGWDAVELRHVDFMRAREAGQTDADVLALVRAQGLPVSAVGVERGWMFATGDERRRLLNSFARVCEWAAALDCPLIMSAVDAEPGDMGLAIDNMRAAGGLASEHGRQIVLELNVTTEQFPTLQRVRDLLARAANPCFGLLVDTYHIQRSDGGLGAYERLAPGEIAYFQYSDVPAGPLTPGQTFDRLPPGQGIVPFSAIFQIVAEKGYRGYLSYEALNPAAWARDPHDVAREALAATRRFL